MFRSPQRLAWATLLVAFALCCAFSAGGAWLIHWVLFDSSLNLHTILYVSRGTIGISAPDDPNERAERVRFPVEAGDQLVTDELSQGHLTISDPLSDGQVVATIQLLGGSQAQLRRASRPRFGLGDAPYTIVLVRAVGRIEVVITPRLEREIRFEIEGGGHKVRLDQSGYYLLQFGVDDLTVTVRQGKALVLDGQGQAKLIEEMETGTLGDEQPVQVETVLVDLSANGLFADSSPEEKTIPDGWGCNKQRDEASEPFGIYERTLFQDRYALHLNRTGPGRDHQATTGCTQNLGVDVSGYDSLRIRATVYLVSHSVSGCGVQGTECAVMLRMRYRSIADIRNNSSSEWVQGFYIHFDSRTGARIRYDPLAAEHIHVNAESWFAFESRDFVLDLPTDQQDSRPVEISEIQVYASGHEYEAYISELSLLGRKNGVDSP